MRLLRILIGSLRCLRLVIYQSDHSGFSFPTDSSGNRSNQSWIVARKEQCPRVIYYHFQNADAVAAYVT